MGFVVSSQNIPGFEAALSLRRKDYVTITRLGYDLSLLRASYLQQDPG